MEAADKDGKRRNMQNADTSHFRFFYEEADQDFAKKLLGRIEGFYLDACQKACGDPGEDRYELYVCGSAEDFIFYTGKAKEDYQDWMVGNTDMERKRLCIASPRAKGDFSEDYEEYLIKVMLHEAVHIAFDRVCAPEDCAIWLSEGIAVWLAGQTEADYISEEEAPKISELGGKWDMDAFADNGGYDYCGVYVWYLVKQQGMEKFLSAYRGECAVEELLEDGFENRAVAAYQKERISEGNH